MVPNVNFFCLNEFLYLEKFEDAKSNDDNIFLKFQSKNTQIRYSWSQIYRCFFPKKLCILTNSANSSVLISNMTIVFQNITQTYPNKLLLIPNLKVLCFAQIFNFLQIRGWWFQTCNNLFSFYMKLSILINLKNADFKYEKSWILALKYA